ncbi:hypothetical protein F751_3345 [Auxenochlorella protothecoides]|uniref:Uncharacterized protein n=1 Tax=Auxenochlorella protothecoides TaxID=3075 RepID=A0A087SBQ0_AUXPR|nr:hypothetical protein F751_3345 [Auxenochlorella protothecoides]KFM23154.1 hypothetical protein F751_3345 [Auxenochlorella protothecoides]
MANKLMHVSRLPAPWLRPPPPPFLPPPPPPFLPPPPPHQLPGQRGVRAVRGTKSWQHSLRG